RNNLYGVAVNLLVVGYGIAVYIWVFAIRICLCCSAAFVYPPVIEFLAIKPGISCCLSREIFPITATTSEMKNTFLM
ncbi:MAG: hypothetical protein ACP5JR_03115, partial [Thermoplasmata archaeon]